MVFVILFILVILAFIGFCFYGLFFQNFMVKKSRQVEARVLSCEEKLMTEKDGNKFSYYLVTVDFYGLNGEMIVKTIKSKKSYKEGDIIPSRYLDKKERLWLGLDGTTKGRNSIQLLKIIGFLAVFLIAVLVIVYMKFSGGDQTERLKYIISLVFIGIGIYGIKKKCELKKHRDNMQIIDGTQVDYYIVPGRAIEEPSDYYPIYEFELNGKLLRYRSNIGGSIKKYRTIGRKVHILIDHETGKITCKEDEQSGSSMYILFGVVGILVLCIMLAGSFGLL